MPWLILLLLVACEAGAQSTPPAHVRPRISAFGSVDGSRPSRVLPHDSGDPVDSSGASSVDHGRLAIVGGVLAGGMVAIHVYQQNGWWADNRAPFHVQEDLSYGLGVDKIGHFHGAAFLAFVFGNALRWANVPEEDALWAGSAGSLLFQTYVEIEDGFSAWGFDRVDFAANVAGASWPIAQHYVPVLENVNLKLSYLPSPLINNPGGVGFRGQKHLMMDDYEGQTFWLALKPRAVLPEAARRYWPEFLGLAVGYGARDIAETAGKPYRVVFLSLDYDMTKIIPQETGFLRTLSRALNFIHFPAPAVRVSPSALWYGLYF